MNKTAQENKVSPKINPAQLAEILGVSSRHIINLYHRGVIPGWRVGKALRFDRAEAMAALRGEGKS